MSEERCMTNCGRPAVFEGWARRRDISGLPTGMVFRAFVCADCKGHPWLIANEGASAALPSGSVKR